MRTQQAPHLLAVASQEAEVWLACPRALPATQRRCRPLRRCCCLRLPWSSTHSLAHGLGDRLRLHSRLAGLQLRKWQVAPALCLEHAACCCISCTCTEQ